MPANWAEPVCFRSHRSPWWCGETGRVHLLSTWDEGVPPEIGRDDLYGLSWNPANLAAALAAIPGVRESRRVGTDGLTPMFAGLLSRLVTSAEFVDAAPVMETARRIKTPDEIICLDVASAIAEAALSALEDALAPGITERELLGVYYERVAGSGAPMPPSESVCFATPAGGPVRFRHLASDRPVRDGELVVLAPGALYAGYEAGLARTRVAGQSSPPARRNWRRGVPASMDALLAACRPGATGADLYRAWEGAGNRDSPVPLAHGLGLGAEPPLIGLGRGTRRPARGGHGAERPILGNRGRRRGVPGARHRARSKARGATILTRYGRL